MTNALRAPIVRDRGLMYVMPDIWVLLAVTAVLAIVSLRTFRWE